MARKAASYSKKRVKPYTRVSKKKGKSYIKTVPPQKIDKFKMGNAKKKDLPHKLTVVTKEKIQIRDSALESCRKFLNNKLYKELAGNFTFEVIPFPHHIQRENKMLTGAGADRMQTGMQLSFGVSASKAAILKKGKEIFEFNLPNKNAVRFTRKLIKKIKSKLPCKIKVIGNNK